MRRALAAVAVLAVLFVLAVGRGGPALATGDGTAQAGSVWYGIQAVLPSATSTRNFAESNVCLTGGDLATITDATFVTSSHLSILGFGEREYSTTGTGYSIDVTRGSLHDADFEHVPVTVPCGAGDRVVFLGYTVALAGALDGSASGLRVSYSIDGHPGTLVLPVLIRLCAPAQAQSSCVPANL